MGPNEVVLHTPSLDRGQTKDEGRDRGAISPGVRDQDVQRLELHDVEYKIRRRLEGLGKEFRRSDGGPAENLGGGGHGSRRGKLPKGDVSGIFGARGVLAGTRAYATTCRAATCGDPTSGETRESDGSGNGTTPAGTGGCRSATTETIPRRTETEETQPGLPGVWGMGRPRLTDCRAVRSKASGTIDDRRHSELASGGVDGGMEYGAQAAVGSSSGGGEG